MGQSIQEWTNQNLWKTAFKNFEAPSDFLKAVCHEFYFELLSFFIQSSLNCLRNYRFPQPDWLILHVNCRKR